MASNTTTTTTTDGGGAVNPFLAYAMNAQQGNRNVQTTEEQQQPTTTASITANENTQNSQNNSTVLPRASISATTYTPAPAAGTPVQGPVPTSDTANNNNNNNNRNNFTVGSPFFSSQLYTGGPSVEYYNNDEDAANRARDEIRSAFNQIGVNAQDTSGEADLIQFVVARQLSRSLRLFACVDVIFCMFFFFTMWLFVFLLFGPILGYQGARYFRFAHVLCYLIYCIAFACWRVALIIVNDSVATKVLMVIMLLVELYIIRLVIKFMQLLKRFSEEELQLLRILENPQRNVWWHQQSGPSQPQVVVVQAGGMNPQQMMMRPPHYR